MPQVMRRVLLCMPEGAAKNCGYPANLSGASLGPNPLKLAGYSQLRDVLTLEGIIRMRTTLSPDVVELSVRLLACYGQLQL